MREFTVTAERGVSPVWVLECPELGAVSQVKSLLNAKEEMAEAIAFLAGIDESEVEINLQVKLDPEMEALKAELLEQRRIAEAASRIASEKTREMIARLKDQKLTTRDISRVLGISHQRVSSIEKSIRLAQSVR